ncbi:MAG: DUF2807 domain-containing protein [Chitinophagales bacterium]|nr:DUF2807 domain-containing protein [Chitinophagales bacterium]
MKIKFSLVLVLIGFLIVSCSGDCKKCKGGFIESPIPLDPVESVNVNFQGTLYLYQDTFQFASVLGPEATILDINRTVRNGVWDLSYPDCFACEDKIEVVLVVPNIKEVKLLGYGNVIAEEKFQQNHISIVNQGSGNIQFAQLSVDSLNCSAEGSGNVSLNGAGARIANVAVSGAGEIELYQFPIINLFAQNSGSGNIYSTVIEYLNAKITGSGSIYYKGSPSVDESNIGSGTVIKQP